MEEITIKINHLERELESVWNALPSWQQKFYITQIDNLLKSVSRCK